MKIFHVYRSAHRLKNSANTQYFRLQKEFFSQCAKSHIFTCNTQSVCCWIIFANWLSMLHRKTKRCKQKNQIEMVLGLSMHFCIILKMCDDNDDWNDDDTLQLEFVDLFFFCVSILKIIGLYSRYTYHIHINHKTPIIENGH